MDLLTVTAAAQRAGCSVAWMRRLAASGRLAGAVQAGPRAWLVPAGEAERVGRELTERRRRPPKGAAEQERPPQGPGG